MNTEEKAKSIEQLDTVRETLDDIVVNQDNPEAWPLFTGLPHSALEKLLEWGVVKDIDIDDLLLVVAGIAYAHGKKEATLNVKAASDSRQ